MTMNRLLLGAALGGLAGHVYSHYISGDARAPSFAMTGAGVGALLGLVLLGKDCPACAIVAVPSSPVVTKGAFAGYPRPLYGSLSRH